MLMLQLQKVELRTVDVNIELEVQRWISTRGIVGIRMAFEDTHTHTQTHTHTSYNHTSNTHTALLGVLSEDSSEPRPHL